MSYGLEANNGANGDRIDFATSPQADLDTKLDPSSLPSSGARWLVARTEIAPEAIPSPDSMFTVPEPRPYDRQWCEENFTN